jgi:hypothetical protein
MLSFVYVSLGQKQPIKQEQLTACVACLVVNVSSVSGRSKNIGSQIGPIY